MKSKITLLIVASIAGLIALCLIQMYLIRNTYELKKDAFLNETRESVSTIDDSFTRVDSMRSLWRDYILEITTAYIRDEIPREAVLDQFRTKTIEMNPTFQDIVNEELEDSGVPTGIKFQKRVRSIVIQDSLFNDTIYSNSKNRTTYILGDDFLGEEYQLGESTSFSECSSSKIEDGKQIIEIIRFNFETETIMNIEGWERQILLQMKGLLALSLGIFLFVIGLLFYSIKNLITQKKIAEVKSDFINNISHEFKTPLTTLSIASNMLRKAEITETSVDAITIIERQNEKLQKLWDQVLNKSLSYNEMKLEKEEVHFEKFLSMLLDDFELTVGEKRVTLNRGLGTAENLLHIDKFYLSTAITNILENAVKYNSGEIVLKVQIQVNRTMNIIIQDNGIGMTEKDQENLFEKFYRIVKDDTHDVKGLGLGLYYANQIVTAHEGRIVVSSKLGEGSTFTIELPLD